MTVARSHPLIALAIAALFVYWIVQDPFGAAAMLRQVFDIVVGFLALVAERVVQFLGALV